ncbi:hypothetical protein [Paludisphaera soli]|uniref:hypothetical protein n=1 Tax=Paludisphaera soli TaxID=2712865 RepID=UPI001F106918|nr:hypothetical protein [Paludisphaera soli]
MRRLHGTTALALLASLALAGCGPTQMGPDPEAFKGVDALYTAISLREPDRVDACLAMLRSLQQDGRLEEAAFDELVAMSGEAKGGDWESVQTRLARFMRGQRRGR